MHGKLPALPTTQRYPRTHAHTGVMLAAFGAMGAVHSAYRRDMLPRDIHADEHARLARVRLRVEALVGARESLQTA